MAKNGLGKTYPNPMVGSVIVLNDSIIGEGWHQKAGEPHAEVNAINSVKDKELLSKAILYVSLEPCSHVGKTPPCANLIVEKSIKNIVIGSIDTNSVVSGRGVRHLVANGCNVIVGVLEDECKELNKRFFTFHSKKRPYIILKWAETSDGFIDKLRCKNAKKSPNWISNSYSQQYVHKLRSDEQAILVGTTTAFNDNPSLNVRSWVGINPIRIVLDRTLKIPENYNLYDQSVQTIVFTEKQIKSSTNKNIYFETVNFKENLLEQICTVLCKYEIQSIIIEGGSKTLQSFINENLWDEAFVFVGDVAFKTGLKAPKMKKAPISIQKISTDALKIYKN